MIIRAAIWGTLPHYSLSFKHFFNYWHYCYSTSSLSLIIENVHIWPWENITGSKIYYSIKMKRYKCNYFWQPYFVRWMYCSIFILGIQYFWDKLADFTTSSILIYCTDLDWKRSPWTRNGWTMWAISDFVLPLWCYGTNYWFLVSRSPVHFTIALFARKVWYKERCCISFVSRYCGPFYWPGLTSFHHG